MFPRFDSPSVFAHLLDTQAGSWQVRPSNHPGDQTHVTVERLYLDPPNIV